MNDLVTLQPPKDLGSNPAETRAIDLIRYSGMVYKY